MCFFIVVNPQFSEAELALYTKRFENGYDLHDARYEEWLNWKSDEIISSGPFSKHNYRQYHPMVNYYNYTWHAVNYLKKHNDMYTTIVLNFHVFSCYSRATTCTICFN